MGWQDDFKLRGDLVQRDVYPFEMKLNELGGRTTGPVSGATHLLKAAIFAGWIEHPTAEVLTDADGEERYQLYGKDISEYPGGALLWYGGEVAKAYTRALVMPPN